MKVLTRCGRSLCARQIRSTELGLIPTVSAMAAAVQWVASCGGLVVVSSTTRSITACGSGGMREGRVLSRRSPSTPSAMNRSCQRQTHGLDTPTRRMIAFVPSPSAVARMIFARQTHFCGLFRSAATASKRARSARTTLHGRRGGGTRCRVCLCRLRLLGNWCRLGQGGVGYTDRTGRTQDDGATNEFEFELVAAGQSELLPNGHGQDDPTVVVQAHLGHARTYSFEAQEGDRRAA